MSQAADWERRSLEIRTSIANGNIERLFEEEYFVLDLLKILYSDAVDTSLKIELLIFLESYGGHYGAIQSASADQIIGSLLDVFNQRSTRLNEKSAFLEQVMMTVTSLVIQLDQFDTDIFRSCCQTLVTVATSGINTMETKRIRSCACRCLTQLEDWSPGCLYREKDVLVKVVKQERTDVYQDYTTLVLKIVENIICSHSTGTNHSDVQTGNGSGLDRQLSFDPQEVRQTVSVVMEHSALFTPSGLWHIVMSLVNLVQHLPEMSPMIFKPMMLHEMASLNICILHLVLYLQCVPALNVMYKHGALLVNKIYDVLYDNSATCNGRRNYLFNFFLQDNREFEKEVLTEDEEEQLLQRLLTSINHPSLSPAHRLFVCHWTRHHSQTCDEGEFLIPHHLAKHYQVKFFPSVFDPPDCQLAKICLLNQSFPSLITEPDGIAAALLLGSVGYLHKMVWHTGSDRVAVVLFRALFHMYQRHCSKSFSHDITRFLRGLISGFPYFIPHALDFIECLRETTPESPVYLEILSLLHHQVVTSAEEQAAAYHYFYLLVLKSASLQKKILPKMTVKFLSYLAENSIYIDDGSWFLGNSILAVCYNLLLCHGTDSLYEDIGDLLFDLMTHYRDTDVRDKAMFLYILLTSSTDEKIQGLLKTTTGTQSFHQALSNLLPGTINREKSQIIELNHPAIKWKRLNVHTNITMKSREETEIEPDKDLSSYFDQLQQSCTTLTAKYAVELSSEKCSRVFAATFHVDSDDNMEPIKDINIPSITSVEHAVEFIICPIKPVPTTCKAWVEYLDGKQTYRCHLQEVTVTLEDIMQPLQTKLFTDTKQDISDMNVKQDGSSNDRDTNREISNMFKSLWQWCTNNNTKSDGIYSLQSVKVLPMTLTDFLARTKDKLHPYAVPSTGEIEACFGMFLPPQYHLLLKFTETNSQTLVTMATDFHQILPFIDKFLISL